MHSLYVVFSIVSTNTKVMTVFGLDWIGFCVQYGGVKDSGIGREGIRYAIQEMTDIKTLLMKDIDVL
jgi:acyl-CoA reductase-like NAD-dependent aldehyde dehydrogenase